MKNLYRTLKTVFPQIVETIINYSETGVFKGFQNENKSKHAVFYGSDMNSNYDIYVKLLLSRNELELEICESGVTVIDTCIPLEKIDSELVLIDAVKDEIDLIITHWEMVLDEFEE